MNPPQMPAGRSARKIVVAGAALATAIGAGTTVGASQPDDAAGTTLYQVDLETGAATMVGEIGSGIQIVGMTIAPAEAGGSVWAITDGAELVTFDAAAPGDATIVPVAGLDPDDALVGIDVRPADGTIVGLTGDGVVFRLDPEAAVATRVGDGINPVNESAAFGWDFNPTVDRIRFDGSSGQNLRLNPDTGAVGTNPETGALTIDGTLAFADGDANAGTAPAVVAAGYTNPVPDATETTLYVIDAASASLAIQDPPNDGVLNTVGALGVDVSDASSFDIASSGDAFLAVPSGAFGS